MRFFRKRVEEPLVDVCLVLEGTYPFVAGGVSSWVHQIVREMPELTFSVLHVSPEVGYYDGHAYDMPENVVGVQEVFLHEAIELRGSVEAMFKRKSVSTFAHFLDEVRDGVTEGFADLADAFQKKSLRGSSSASLPFIVSIGLAS